MKNNYHHNLKFEQRTFKSQRTKTHQQIQKKSIHS